MIECAHLTNAFTYQGIMEAAYGRKGFLFLSLLQFIYPFIGKILSTNCSQLGEPIVGVCIQIVFCLFLAMVSYNIIVGDTLTKVMVRLFDVTANSIFVRRDFVIGIATLFITSPLCLMKNLVGLARASVLSFFLILFIMATFFVRIGSMATIV